MVCRVCPRGIAPRPRTSAVMVQCIARNSRVLASRIGSSLPPNGSCQPADQSTQRGCTAEHAADETGGKRLTGDCRDAKSDSSRNEADAGAQADSAERAADRTPTSGRALADMLQLVPDRANALHETLTGSG